ncbi:hypothetical protein TESG_06474 [Trichophyton tonsurans CBS 112818]|uniref:Uncharacterized protein n=2 Tax=Trichophyton TaxID=5550 RepID=F2PWJ8_TRIEC|nr:hypothetical protein TESG_06474 [Trichophyton tonsurans CBS 112818]EGE06266.1 hypothetical protein TEQG_05270 [Trichophyton equinum CBS 127.97]
MAPNLVITRIESNCQRDGRPTACNGRPRGTGERPLLSSYHTGLGSAPMTLLFSIRRTATGDRRLRERTAHQEGRGLVMKHMIKHDCDDMGVSRLSDIHVARQPPPSKPSWFMLDAQSHQKTHQT